jgi:hypothetical protein
VKVIKAPQPIGDARNLIFLAGSIEQGTAINWQEQVTAALEGNDVTILNPRRDDWDSSWVQSIDNPQFREQVEWELDALNRADGIIMYFDPNTKSPISLLELGLHARHDGLVVCCPEGFWRKGNVDVVCKKYNIAQIETLEKLIENLKGVKWTEEI